MQKMNFYNHAAEDKELQSRGRPLNGQSFETPDTCVKTSLLHSFRIRSQALKIIVGKQHEHRVRAK